MATETLEKRLWDASARRGSRLDEPAAYHAEGILYLPVEARFDYLLHPPKPRTFGAKVSAAMRDIENHNPRGHQHLVFRKPLDVSVNSTIPTCESPRTTRPQFCPWSSLPPAH